MPNGRNIDNPSSGGRASSEANDIDALIGGAVYGELTPAEQARLSAHLQTHPNDQRALDDLRATRQVIRESRFPDHQIDPPQSVSALLMQEAARRAPKRDTEQGWFARLVSGLVAHPALASVASLVLVIGVAGTLYLKNGEVSVAERPMAQSASERALGARAVAPTGRAAAAEAIKASGRGAPMEEAAIAEPVASDKEGVRVGLDDNSRGGKGIEGQRGISYDSMNEMRAQFKAPKAKAAPAKDAQPQFGGAKSEMESAPAQEPQAELARTKSDVGNALGKSPGADPVRRAKKAAQDGLADSFDAPSDRTSAAPEPVASRERTDGADSAASGAMRNASSRPQKPSPPPAAIAADSESDRDEAPAGKFAAAPRAEPVTNAQRQAANVQGQPDPAMQQQTKAPTVANTQQQVAPAVNAPQQIAPAANVRRSATQTANASRQAAPGSTVQQAAPFATAPKSAGPAGTAGGYGAAAYAADEGSYGRGDSAKQEAKSSTWSRDTHRRVLALIRAGKCQDASPLVQQLKSRDPNYYAANLAGDRSLSPCLARIAETAERDAKTRKKEAAKAGMAQ